VWLGRAVLAERDATAAIALLGELPQAGAPPLLLADLLTMVVETGHLAEAERLTQTALRESRAAEVLLARALLHERRGELSAARALLDTALRTAEPPALRSRVHEVRAELEARAGNLHRAQLERAAAQSDR
jgi:tetratricopeptide (TPR) repeat protein